MGNKEKIKVGYFSHSSISPSETFIYDLVKGLNNVENIDLTFVNGSLKPVNVDFDLKTITTGYDEKRKSLSFKIYSIGQIFGGKGHYWKNKFRKKNAHRILSYYNLPKFDVVYIDYASSALLLMDYLSDKKIPFIVHVHGYDVTSSLNDPVYRKQFHTLIKKAKGFIAASYHVKRLLVLEGADPLKIKVIRYGLDTTDVEPLEWAERKNSAPSIIFLGRLTPKKHPLALLQAFSIVKERIPETTLTIIGDGPLRKEVEKRIRHLDLEESVTLLGVLNREQSFPIVNKHWIYAQHSVTSSEGDQEGFAISLAEAAMHELPVVSTIHNGITENVKDNITGYLVPEFNYELMAEKLIYLIQHPDVAEKMGKEGREHIIRICNPETRITKVSNYLQQIVYG